MAKKKKTAQKANTAKKTAPKNVENEKVVAILAYFLIGIIWYFADPNMKNSSLAKFHTKQALNLIVVSIALQIILTVLIITILLMPIVNLVILVLAILGIVNAANGKEKEVPIVGKLADMYLKF